MMIGSSFHAAFGDLRLQRLERQARALRAERAALRLLLRGTSAIWRALAASATWKTSPGCGRPGEAEHFDRRRRPGRLRRPPAIVDERAHAADDRTGDERVADAERAVLHEHGRHRAAPSVELRLRARCPVALRFGLALSSPMSVTSRIISSSSSRFCFFWPRLRR